MEIPLSEGNIAYLRRKVNTHNVLICPGRGQRSYNKSMITVQKPDPEDARAIQEVLYNTWLDTYPNKEIGITEEDVKAHFKKSLSPEMLEKRRLGILTPPPNQVLLVAKDSNKVVGICRIVLRENVNQLQAIYVLPSYQRKGVGMLLWKTISKFLDPTKKTIVHVATYNEKAIDFYKKIGFSETGKKFVDDRFKMPVSGVLIPETELVLEK